MATTLMRLVGWYKHLPQADVLLVIIQQHGMAQMLQDVQILLVPILSRSKLRRTKLLKKPYY